MISSPLNKLLSFSSVSLLRLPSLWTNTAGTPVIGTSGNVPNTAVPAPSPRRDTIKPCKVVRAVRELPVGTAAGPEGAERSRAAAAYAFSSAAPEAKLFQILNVLKVFMSWPLSEGLARTSTSETSAIAESPSSGHN